MIQDGHWIARHKELFFGRMVVEAAKIYDAKARIFVLEKLIIDASDLKEIREITNEISILENVIEVNQEKLNNGHYTRAAKSQNIPSSMNGELKCVG